MKILTAVILSITCMLPLASRAAEATAEFEVTAEIAPEVKIHGPQRNRIPAIKLQFNSQNRTFSQNTTRFFIETNVATAIDLELTSEPELVHSVSDVTTKIPFALTLNVLNNKTTHPFAKNKKVSFSYQDLKLGTFNAKTESEFLIVTLNPVLDQYVSAAAGQYKATVTFKASPASATL